jgi:hypothetical protein
MLCRDGTVKLLDLGLVRFTLPEGEDGTERHKPLTRNLPALSFVGTPQYLAPEQVLDSSGADFRADLFGLGATLYYLVTARPPRITLPDSRVPAPSPPDIPQVFAALPPELGELAARLMATDPDYRPASAGEVADELAHLAPPQIRSGSGRRTGVIEAPAPRTAADTPPTVIFPKRRPRRRALLVTGAAAMLLVVGLVAPGLWAKFRRPATPPPPAAEVHDGGVLVPPGKPVRSLAVSPDNRLAAVTTFDGQTQLWDAETGKQVAVLPGHGARVAAAAFSADGRRLVFGASRTSVGVWDVPSRTTAFTFDTADWALSAAISADGTRVAAGDRAGTTWVWDTTTNDSRALTLDPKARVDVVAFPPGSRLPVSGLAARGEVVEWDDAEPVRHARPGGWVHNGFGALTDGRVVTATATEVSVFDPNGLAADVSIRPMPAEARFGGVAGGPGGQWVATVGSYGFVRVWDARTGSLLASLALAQQPLVAVAVSADGTTGLAATEDGCVRRVRFTGLR